MSMIIKKWNGTSFDELYPKTKASMLYAADGTTTIFDSNTKLKPAHLPDMVFDSLFFASDISASGNLWDVANQTITNLSVYYSRSPKGMYFVATSTITLTSNPITPEVSGSLYYTTNIFPGEEGSVNPATVTLEPGDWIVVSRFEGEGTSSNPYSFYFAVINNTYENATSSAPGIVKYFSNTVQSDTPNTVSDTVGRTYGIQTNGNNQMVVNVPWTDTLYVHPTYTYGTPTASDTTTLSDIKLFDGITESNGHITGSTFRRLVAGTNVSISAANDGNITINSSFVNTTYTAGEGLTLTGTEFRETYPLYVQADAPTTAVTGAIWFDI
jgi:hypothetical protein